MAMKRSTISTTAAQVLIFLVAAVMCAQSYLRNITGTVTDEDGEPLKGAVVQLKDMASLQVRSYVTQAEGKYAFCCLHADADYQLKVQYRGKFTGSKSVTRLNPHKNVKVDFRIHVE